MVQDSRQYQVKPRKPDRTCDCTICEVFGCKLQSNGSYVYANRYTDCNGAQVVMLIRACYCPGVICNIISEPVLVYQEKCSITFGGNGRIITMSDGKKLCLSMTSNGLGCGQSGCMREYFLLEHTI